MKKVTIIATLLVAVGLIITPVMAAHEETPGAAGFAHPMKPTLIAVDHKNNSITFGGVVMADKWDAFVHPVDRFAEKGFDPDHWHLIISGTQANPSNGRMAIFAGWAGDVEVSEALAALGAKVDKTSKFEVKSYNERLKKDSPYPDYKPAGTAATVYITWTEKNGKEKTVEANEFLTNSTGKKLELVYVGKIHPSHCIACMYGCPGGKISNNSLTVRDYFDRGAAWKLKKGVLPPDGTPVLITIKLKV